MSENRMNRAGLAKRRIIVCHGHYAVFRIIRRSHIPMNSNNCLLGAHKLCVVHAVTHRHRGSEKSCITVDRPL